MGPGLPGASGFPASGNAPLNLRPCSNRAASAGDIGGGTASVTVNSVTGTTQGLAGLNVQGQLYFPSSKTVVRSILYMQNPTGAPITVTVDNDNNLGSDEGTTIHQTSSGDATFDATDNWFVSSDNLVPIHDPILTYAIQGQDGSVRGTNIDGFGNGSNNFNERFTVTVPAGETRGSRRGSRRRRDGSGSGCGRSAVRRGHRFSCSR